MLPYMTGRLVAVLVALALAGCAGFSRPKPSPLPSNITFEGAWDSTWGRMAIKQEGKHVHGTFTGYREGGLSGELDGNIWKFVWDQRVPRQHGHGYLQMSADGQHIEGRWGYAADDLEGGRWAGDRDNNATE